MFKYYKLSDLQDSMEAICNAKPKIYTQEELDEAIQAENKACAEICEGMLFEDWTDADRQVLCAEAIRARNK